MKKLIKFLLWFSFIWPIALAAQSSNNLESYFSNNHIAAYNTYLLRDVCTKVFAALKAEKIIAFKDSIRKDAWKYPDLRSTISELYSTHSKPNQSEYDAIDTIILTDWWSEPNFTDINLHTDAKGGLSIGYRIKSYDNQTLIFYISFNDLSPMLSIEEHSLFNFFQKSIVRRINVNDSSELYKFVHPIFIRMYRDIYDAVLNGKVQAYRHDSDIASGKKMEIIRKNNTSGIQLEYNEYWQGMGGYYGRKDTLTLTMNDSKDISSLIFVNNWEQKGASTSIRTDGLGICRFADINGIKIPNSTMFYVKWIDVLKMYSSDDLVYMLGLMNFLRLESIDKYRFNNGADINDFYWGN